MVYRFLADLILVLHFCYVLFAIFGGLLVLRRRWMWKFHLPALVWGFIVQYFVWICPLTNWENYFRELSGQAGYEGGFIEYYISAILYPGIITPQIHLFMAISLVVFNLLVYSYIIWRVRRYP
jgi:Na+-transporting NADH:ubiquinone oxidoreductase subunit NqrB